MLSKIQELSARMNTLQMRIKHHYYVHQHGLSIWQIFEHEHIDLETFNARLAERNDNWWQIIKHHPWIIASPNTFNWVYDFIPQGGDNWICIYEQHKMHDRVYIQIKFFLSADIKDKRYQVVIANYEHKYTSNIGVFNKNLQDILREISRVVIVQEPMEWANCFPDLHTWDHEEVMRHKNKSFTFQSIIPAKAACADA